MPCRNFAASGPLMEINLLEGKGAIPDIDGAGGEGEVAN